MNMDILEEFPFPPESNILKYAPLLKKAKEVFMANLFSVFDSKRNRFLTSNIKSHIDLLDLMLGKIFYGLEYNEILHIMNYDFEIRGGIKLQQPFITLVDQILAAKKKDPNADTSALEHQIDKMVYKLYGLTDDEIAIVHNP